MALGAAPALLAAQDTARTAGQAAGMVVGFVVAAALFMLGARVKRRATTTGARVGGMAMMVAGVMIVFGGLGSLAGVAGT